jgi:hypothetical protein
MSLITFSFNPAALPAETQPLFMARFFQLVTEYQILSAVPVSPPAESLPQPSSFVAFEGDEAPPVPSGPKTYEEMSGQELRDRRADLLGFVADHPQRRRSPAKLTKKADLIAEIRRLEAEAAPAADALPPAVRTPNNGGVNLGRFDGPAAEADANSETSSKKPRKNGWANYTPEQKAERIAHMKAAREAKKAERKMSADSLAAGADAAVAAAVAAV